MTNSLQDMRRPLARDVKRETIRSNGHNVIVPPQYVIFMFFFFLQAANTDIAAQRSSSHSYTKGSNIVLLTLRTAVGPTAAAAAAKRCRERGQDIPNMSLLRRLIWMHEIFRER